MEIKKRFENPYFVFGLIGVIFSASGIDFEMMTNWGILWDSIVSIFMNPFLLTSVIVAIIGVFVNPTTKGLRDKEIKNDK